MRCNATNTGKTKKKVVFFFKKKAKFSKKDVIFLGFLRKTEKKEDKKSAELSTSARFTINNKNKIQCKFTTFLFIMQIYLRHQL